MSKNIFEVTDNHH